MNGRASKCEEREIGLLTTVLPVQLDDRLTDLVGGGDVVRVLSLDDTVAAWTHALVEVEVDLRRDVAGAARVHEITDERSSFFVPDFLNTLTVCHCAS